MNEIKVLDVVAVLEDVPQHGLLRGEVGTVLELWKDGAFEVGVQLHIGKSLRLRTLTPAPLQRISRDPSRVARTPSAFLASHSLGRPSSVSICSGKVELQQLVGGSVIQTPLLFTPMA